MLVKACKLKQMEDDGVIVGMQIVQFWDRVPDPTLWPKCEQGSRWVANRGKVEHKGMYLRKIEPYKIWNRVYCPLTIDEAWIRYE